MDDKLLTIIDREIERLHGADTRYSRGALEALTKLRAQFRTPKIGEVWDHLDWPVLVVGRRDHGPMFVTLNGDYYGDDMECENLKFVAGSLKEFFDGR